MNYLQLANTTLEAADFDKAAALNALNDGEYLASILGAETTEEESAEHEAIVSDAIEFVSNFASFEIVDDMEFIEGQAVCAPWVLCKKGDLNTGVQFRSSYNSFNWRTEVNNDLSCSDEPLDLTDEEAEAAQHVLREYVKDHYKIGDVNSIDADDFDFLQD